MKAEFNERSYESAFTNDFIEPVRHLLSSPPNLLDPYVEHRLGYDVEIAFIDNRDLKVTAYYFQFKIPSFIAHSTAPIVGDSKTTISPPYYRMSLYSEDSYNQQKKLESLEIKFPNSVFYATPAFHIKSDFLNFIKSRTICDESVYFSPLNIGKLENFPTKSNHKIVYTKDSDISFLCSDPVQLKKYNFSQVMEIGSADESIMTIDEISDSILQVLDNPDFGFSHDEFIYIVNHFIDAWQYYYPFPTDLLRPAAKVRALRFLVRNYFDCEVYFVSKKNR